MPCNHMISLSSKTEILRRQYHFDFNNHPSYIAENQRGSHALFRSIRKTSFGKDMCMSLGP